MLHRRTEIGPRAGAYRGFIFERFFHSRGFCLKEECQMRINQPVTQRDWPIGDDVTLMSTTDPQSHITYANAAFVEASGFTLEELTGQPHNLVRHPDMPPEAFADM
jgi:PAS domain-containing protein